jgi:hypothetical protein
MLCLATAATLAIGRPALGQQPSLKAQLVGTWAMGVVAVNRKDGTRADVFGPNPNGVLMFHPDGISCSSVPGQAGPSTPAAIVCKGRRRSSEKRCLDRLRTLQAIPSMRKKKTFVIKIKGSTFPDYEGTEQIRPFTIVGDELRSINPNPSQGGAALDLVLKRLPKVE